MTLDGQSRDWMELADARERAELLQNVHRRYVSVEMDMASMTATVIQMHQRMTVNDVFGQVYSRQTEPLFIPGC